MRKQRAEIVHKRSKLVEKAVMMNKTVQLKLDFDLSVTAWVPSAKVNKPMPQVNLTLNVSYDDVRLGCNTAEELIDGLMEIVVFLEKNKEVLNTSAKTEQQKWIELCNLQMNKTKGLQIVDLIKKQA
jgi:hypothetical protein